MGMAVARPKRQQGWSPKQRRKRAEVSDWTKGYVGFDSGPTQVPSGPTQVPQPDQGTGRGRSRRVKVTKMPNRIIHVLTDEGPG